uniref:Uncharacterized protein n=1 Tax=Anguilla anguilla TaxID=7936 RepID=A0A0E9XR73_ANGAN
MSKFFPIHQQSKKVNSTLLRFKWL